jgi:hypothetical protein
MGDEDSSWLSDEAYQTYSIRVSNSMFRDCCLSLNVVADRTFIARLSPAQAGTAGWQEGLRRQLLLQRFRVLHPDNPLNKTIWQHRLQKQYLKEEQERVFKKRKVRSTRLFGLPCTQGMHQTVGDADHLCGAYCGRRKGKESAALGGRGRDLTAALGTMTMTMTG